MFRSAISRISQVRRMAEEAGLPNTQKDSTGIASSASGRSASS